MSTTEGGRRIITDSLILYLDAGNPKSYIGTGTSITDLSNGNNNSTFIGSVSFSGSNGGVFVINGLGNYINCGGPNNDGLDTDSFTIACWFKGGGYTICRGNDGGFGAGWSMILNSGGFSVVVNGSNYPCNFSTVINTNIWNFCVGVYNRPTGVLKCYVNGILSNTTNSAANGTLRSSTRGFVIGTNAPSLSSFSGVIGNTFAYNRVLSDAEILKCYNITKSRYL